MASAGTVEINFAAETAKFTAELKKVRGDLRSLKDDTESMAKGFAKVGNAFRGLFAAAAIGIAIRAVVKATQESEEAVALLNNALKNSGAVVARTSDDFQRFASELQRTSTFGDEAIIGVETLLLGFRGLSGGVIKQATADILDLSTRMGIDLNSAAKVVGKALEDPVKGMTALRKAGLQFTDSQKDLIKSLIETGDKAGAQQVILKELEARFGGAAAAARDTFGGALKGVKNAFDDLLEAKGGVPDATRELNNFAKMLSDPRTKEAADNLFTGLLKGMGLVIKGWSEILELAEKMKPASQDQLAAESRLSAVWGERTLALRRVGLAHERLTELRKAGAGTGDIEQATSAYEKEQGAVARLNEEYNKLAENLKAVSAPTPVKWSAIQSPGHGTIKEALPDFTTMASQFDEEENAAEEATKKEIAAREKLLTERIRIETAWHDWKFTANQAEQDRFDAANAIVLEKLTTFGLNRVGLEDQVLRELAVKREEWSAEEIAFEEKRRAEVLKSEEQILAFKQRGAQAAVSLLTAYGGKFKALGQAILFFEKAKAIKAAIIDTHAAVMKTLATYGGTPWGFAAAAGVAVYGAAQVAAIASETGLFGGANDGRASAGSPNNPIFTEGGAGGDDRTFGATAQSAVQITINGFVGPEILDEMLDSIREAVGDKDVVIIDKGSRQGQELLGG